MLYTTQKFHKNCKVKWDLKASYFGYFLKIWFGGGQENGCLTSSNFYRKA